MFNVGPMEFVVLALVGLIVLGPDKLPGLTRDAARMLRTLREMATGARTQLKNELGPEFADVDLSALNDLRSLNPRTALTRALFSDDEPETAAEKPADLNPAAAQPPAQRPLGRGEKAPFDVDAT
jgi:sec-independent protein translocase protein TatB